MSGWVCYPSHMAYGHEILDEAAFTESDDCIFFTDRTGNQGKVTMFGRKMTGARAVWIIRHGTPRDGLFVLHSCNGGSGRWGCININHLYLGTPKNNTADMIADLGRHNRAILTTEDVYDIRSRVVLGPGGNAREIAAEYGVSKRAITDIASRRTWKHL